MPPDELKLKNKKTKKKNELINKLKLPTLPLILNNTFVILLIQNT